MRRLSAAAPRRHRSAAHPAEVNLRAAVHKRGLAGANVGGDHIIRAPSGGELVGNPSDQGFLVALLPLLLLMVVGIPLAGVWCHHRASRWEGWRWRQRDEARHAEASLGNEQPTALLSFIAMQSVAGAGRGLEKSSHPPQVLEEQRLALRGKGGVLVEVAVRDNCVAPELLRPRGGAH